MRDETTSRRIRCDLALDSVKKLDEGEYDFEATNANFDKLAIKAEVEVPDAPPSVSPRSPA
eukprot:648011-Rhodomonas_salina.1